MTTSRCIPRFEDTATNVRAHGKHMAPRHILRHVFLAGVLSVVGNAAVGQEARIEVRANQIVQRMSRYLAGACIEDVNHEIYGGIYSQMIFGESFQEPAPASPPMGFKAYGGRWQVRGDELWAGGSDGPKLVSDQPVFDGGAVGVEVLLPDRTGGNAGLIVKVSGPGLGADNFEGYEVSLDASAQILRLGRHRHNWEHIKDTRCTVPVGRWIRLEVKMTERRIEALVDGRSIVGYEDVEHPLHSGTVGLRPWQREARFRNLWVQTNGAKRVLAFERAVDETMEVSGMWRAVRRGSVTGRWGLETARPFAGAQSQRMTLVDGDGEIGLENQGLNRWGLSFVAGKPYEGYVWVRAEKSVDLFVAQESRDGAQVHAETRLSVTSNTWQRLDFTLTPGVSDTAGRFALKLKQPGSVTAGHAFLQPGEWGRFKGLPVRRDVAEALIGQGITVLRYGGSMVNHPEYRWKKMIGPRDRRPPYRGTWYAHSSNGWGIPDFVEFCEAAGFLCIPAFHMDESAQDLADFMEYANGPADSEWGLKRAADGHATPYRLRHIELGNEERVDDGYFQKFKALAEAIWRQDGEVILVVGDFVYSAPIRDPFKFTGAASGITSLAAHQKILDLAKARGREVWFDVHIGTDGPGRSRDLEALPSYIEAIDKVANGARHKVVVFEFNAGNHQHRRALGNALAIHAIERMSERVPIATSANCLQPDGQNDNGWDQGLLFLNPSKVWLQPPGWVTRMISLNYQPLLVHSEVQNADTRLDVTAKRSEDGATLVLQVVNLGNKPAAATIRLESFQPSKPVAAVEELAGSLDAVNTAADPERIKPARSEWRHGFTGGAVRRTFAPQSFTVIRFE